MHNFSYILCFLWSCLISLFAIPSVRNLAFKKRLLDEPNLRSMHELSTPRLGGLAIFAGFLSAITLFGSITFEVQTMISGAILIFFIGLKDDIVPVSPVKKFFVQILSTSIILFIGEIRIKGFDGFLGIFQLNDGVSYLFSALVIIAITNSINLIDGLDGLAGTVILIITLTLGLVFYNVGVHPLVGTAVCLAGAVVGFLRYNFHKANIFMGDAGSLTSGYIIAFMTINFINLRPFDATISFAVAILYIPILDTARVFALRIIDGQSPFVPDKNHLHHVLSRLGLPQKSIILFLVLLNIFVIFMVWQFSHLGNTMLILSEVILAAVIVIILKLLDR